VGKYKWKPKIVPITAKLKVSRLSEVITKACCVRPDMREMYMNDETTNGKIRDNAPIPTKLELE
jgi:hypothetical protein